jgi:MSHA biogenesis protein MshG
MPFFNYKGVNAQGEREQGVLEAADSGEVANQLQQRGVIPIDIIPAKEPARQRELKWLTQAMKEKITPMDIMMFSRQMHTLLKAGVPILQALAGLQESTPNKSFAAALGEVRRSLDSGRNLADSLARQPKVFSVLFVNMVRVGESVGILDDIFMQMYHYYEFEKGTRDQIKAALHYPAFVIAALLIVLIIINIFIVPSFVKVYISFHAELPLLTRGLIAFSNFWLHYWPLMLVSVVGSVYGFHFYTRTTSGKYWWDKFKLKLPIAGSIIRKATLARFARGFALADKSGIPITQAFTLVAGVVENVYIEEKIGQMRLGVERGENMVRTAKDAGIFNPLVLQMIAVGEETGEMDALMQEIANMYAGEVDYEVKNLSANIEPILIVSLSVIVLLLALGVFLPMWDLGKALNK